MTVNKYALEMIDSLFEEGDHDFIFFNQILDAVSFDENDLPVAKSIQQRTKDALKLVEYFISLGNFDVGCMERGQKDDLAYVPCAGGFDEFCKRAEHLISQNGLEDDYLNFGMRLRKLHQGALPPPITQEIESIFKMQ